MQYLSTQAVCATVLRCNPVIFQKNTSAYGTDIRHREGSANISLATGHTYRIDLGISGIMDFNVSFLFEIQADLNCIAVVGSRSENCYNSTSISVFYTAVSATKLQVINISKCNTNNVFANIAVEQIS